MWFSKICKFLAGEINKNKFITRNKQSVLWSFFSLKALFLPHKPRKYSKRQSVHMNIIYIFLLLCVFTGLFIVRLLLYIYHCSRFSVTMTSRKCSLEILHEVSNFFSVSSEVNEFWPPPASWSSLYFHCLWLYYSSSQSTFWSSPFLVPATCYLNVGAIGD